MIKYLSLLLFCALFFTGCKREYAFVQPAKVDVFVHKQQRKKAPKEVTKTLKVLQVQEVVQHKSVNHDAIASHSLLSNETPELKSSKRNFSELNKSNKAVLESNNNFSIEKRLPVLQLQKTKKTITKKKKKNNFRRLGTMIPTGFIFLGIAILLSLINLNGLALLFGVAAILFLFLGFKKLLRKKRRRDIFR